MYEPTLARLFDIIDVQLHKFPKKNMFNKKVANSWKEYSTREVKELIDRLSAGLLSLKVGFKEDSPEGVDKIVIVSNNCPEWMILDIAVQQVGAVLVPVYPTTNPSEFIYILKETEAKYVFVGDDEILKNFENSIGESSFVKDIYTFEKTNKKNWQELLQEKDATINEKISNIKSSITPERIATIIYTSGTTGLPKGVMLSHKNIVSNLIFDKRDLPFPDAPQWKTISFLPLNHIFERVVNYFYMLSGVSIYYVSDISLIGEYMKEIKPDVFTTVPRLLEKVFEKIMATGHALSGLKRKIFFWSVGLAQKYDNRKKLSSYYKLKLSIADKLVYRKWRNALGGNIKFIVSGGAACQVKLLRIFYAAKIQIIEGYGPTENSPVIAANRRVDNDIYFGTVGVPFGDQQVKIAEDGEILVKGPCVMMGYYKNPELTSETIIDGWLHTGDVGTWIENRYIKITDRKKEIFKTSGGKYVAPLPIENKLKENALIEQAMIIGEGEKFVAALIVPAFDTLKSYLSKKGISYSNNENMINKKEVVDIYTNILTKTNKHFNKVEQIKKYKLLSIPWSIETGEMSPKMSLKRKSILEKYETEIDQIYS